MPISLRPITKYDVPRLVDIQFAAMRSSGHFRSIGDIPNQDGTTDAFLVSPERANKISRILDGWGADPTLHFLKAVEVDSDEILAFAKWHVYRGEEGLKEWRASVRTDAKMRIPSGANKEGFRFCKTKFFERRKAFFGEGKEHCLLAMLATDPLYERQGAGSLLTQWGCDLADKYGIDCYLEASKKGYPMYKRKGFEEAILERGESGLHFDVRNFTGRGGEEEEEEGDWVDLTCMIRKAQRKKGF
ncbi:hypothetical protein N7474_003143 [Penicillium riverlandense]|uniref:uncharacterized protein n=1 Tax=Penicillium riverlandense TaxID=1903569 RepID=UPI002547944D|nr:uncharacterized protein N7474_003143 [Penicillium riverlandense]KAJ5826005.1 hypothetical protein N7474_003143 [Penicillium riverlandense]